APSKSSVGPRRRSFNSRAQRADAGESRLPSRKLPARKGGGPNEGPKHTPFHPKGCPQKTGSHHEDVHWGVVSRRATGEATGVAPRARRRRALGEHGLRRTMELDGDPRSVGSCPERVPQPSPQLGAPLGKVAGIQENRKLISASRRFKPGSISIALRRE